MHRQVGYVSNQTHTKSDTYIHIHTHHQYIHTHQKITYIYIHIYINIYLRIYRYLYAYVYTYVYIHIYICIYLYVCIGKSDVDMEFVKSVLQLAEVSAEDTCEFVGKLFAAIAQYLRCNTLQHTATHCNTLQHTASHCSTLQHTATYCNILQRTVLHMRVRKQFLCCNYPVSEAHTKIADELAAVCTCSVLRTCSVLQCVAACI